VGFDVRVHGKLFNHDEDDHVWIPDVAARGWVIFSSDKRISKDPINVRSVRESKAQVVMSSDNNTLPELWGAAFITGRLKLEELLERNPGPVFIQVSGHPKDHVKLAPFPRAPGQQIEATTSEEHAIINSAVAGVIRTFLVKITRLGDIECAKMRDATMKAGTNK
jgi:hypothetical protein